MCFNVNVFVSYKDIIVLVKDLDRWTGAPGNSIIDVLLVNFSLNF